MTSQALRKTSTSIRVAVAGAAMLAGLAACGETGPLQQAPPLFGAQARRDYYAQRANQAQAAAARNTNGQNTTGSAEREANSLDDDAPLTTRDVQDPDEKLTTPRDSPVPGAPNPLGPTVSTTPPN